MTLPRYLVPVLISATCLSAAAFAADGPYHFIREIPVGGSAQWDYLTIDPDSHRLYLSHGAKVDVIDVITDKIVGTIENTPGIHGIALAPKLGRAFTSNGQEAKASIVDLASLKTVSKTTTGANPDCILYSASRNEVYTFNGRSKSATVFDPASGKVIATIDLGGKPEFAVEDGPSGLAFVNIEDKSEVVVIDLKTHQAIHHWPIAPGESASGMAIDLEHHRLFLGCDNKKMVMMDSTSGKVVGTVPIGAGVDANAFDPSSQLAFSSNGEEGTVTIAHEVNPGALTVVQTLKTVVGARTMALDPVTHQIYLPAPTPSFRVLVYGPTPSK